MRRFCTRPAGNTGFALIEVILAVSLAGIMVTFLIGAVMFAERVTYLSGDRTRAAFLAEEGLEAVRNIRDAGFSDLADGTYGLAISAGQWQLVGAEDVTGIFTRTITIGTIDAATKSVLSTVDWNAEGERSGAIALSASLTDWARKAACAAAGDCLAAVTASAALAPGDSQVVGALVGNAGSAPITIQRIMLTWSGVAANTRVQGISINGAAVWSGSARSGDSIIIAPVVLPAGDSLVPVDYIRFSRKMSKATLTITFIMSDGSTKASDPIIL